jgi:hypothetical protein
LVTGGTPATRASHIALLLDGLPQQASTHASGAVPQAAASAPGHHLGAREAEGDIKPASTPPAGGSAYPPSDSAAGAVSAPAGPIAVILEGSAFGPTPLDERSGVEVHRVAPGCLCCTGNLVLRVTLNRILRVSPAHVFIALADTSHVDQLRSWLQQPPYDQLLCLTPDEALEKHLASPTSEAR